MAGGGSAAPGSVGDGGGEKEEEEEEEDEAEGEGEEADDLEVDDEVFFTASRSNEAGPGLFLSAA